MRPWSAIATHMSKECQWTTCRTSQAAFSSIGAARDYYGPILRSYGSQGRSCITQLNSRLFILLLIPAFFLYHGLAKTVSEYQSTRVPQYGLVTSGSSASRASSLSFITPVTLPDFHPSCGFLLFSFIRKKPWVWRLSNRVMNMSLW